MRRLVKWVTRPLLALVLIVVLLTVNVAMLASTKAYDALWAAVRTVVSSVTDAPWAKRSTFAELDLDIKKLDADLDVTRSEIDTKTKKLVQLDADLLSEKQTNQAVTAKLVRVREDRQRIASELENSLKRLDRTERQLAARQVDLDRASRELVSRQAVQAEQLDELITSRRSMSQLQTKLDVTQADLRAARRLLQTPTSAISDDALQAAQRITKDMKSRTVSSIRRNAAGDLSELVPFLGTVTGVGLIAWDLYDTCQQLKSFQELEKAISGQKEDTSIVDEQCGMSREQLMADIMGTDLQLDTCIEARLRTRLIDPPECDGYELQQPDYTEAADPEPVELKLPDY